jgi:hypothetical protein
MDPLITELSGAHGPWDVTFALLGPAGSGKTEATQFALQRAAGAGVRCGYIDLRQAREIWDPDKFYGWLLRGVKDVLDPDQKRNGRKGSPQISPRVAWCDSIARLLGRRKDRVLLAFDHIECIADTCAHDLISDLREIQDRSASEAVWNRFRCIIAGSVSVYQLRRRANSPNLQFTIRRLPFWSVTEAESETRRHLAVLGRQLDDTLISALAALTSGEPAFVNLVNHYLPAGPVSGDDVDQLPALIVKDALRYVELAAPAKLYALDPRFRDCAHDVLDGRPANWCDPAADIDHYQLAGALVTGDPTRREARFRNELVRQAVAALRNGGPASQETATALAQVPSVVLQRRCVNATSLGELLEALTDSWQHFAGVPGQPRLMLRDAVETRAFLLDHESIAIEQRMRSTAADLEALFGRVSARVTRRDGQWLVDAQIANQNHMTAGIRVSCGAEFVPTVSMREVLRIWALFLEPCEKTLQTIGVDALGRAALKGRLPHGGKRVFVSSTYSDLKEHRQLVMEQIVRRDLLFRGMEHFGAHSDQPSTRIVEEVRESDVYVGIFGARYGFIDKQTGLSMTELEFNEAEARGMPLLLYVAAPDAELKRGDVETDPDATRKLMALLARVKSHHVVYQFESPMDLARQVYTDLNKYT